jgi:hypothetical protein
MDWKKTEDLQELRDLHMTYIHLKDENNQLLESLKAVEILQNKDEFRIIKKQIAEENGQNKSVIMHVASAGNETDIKNSVNDGKDKYCFCLHVDESTLPDEIDPRLTVSQILISKRFSELCFHIFKHRLGGTILLLVFILTWICILLSLIVYPFIGWFSLLMIPEFFCFFGLLNWTLLKRLLISFEWWSMLGLVIGSCLCFIDTVSFDPPRVAACITLGFALLLIICLDARPFGKRKIQAFTLAYLTGSCLCWVLTILWWFNQWYDYRQSIYLVNGTVKFYVTSVGFSAFTTISTFLTRYTITAIKSNEANPLMVLYAPMSYRRPEVEEVSNLRSNVKSLRLENEELKIQNAPTMPKDAVRTRYHMNIMPIRGMKQIKTINPRRTCASMISTRLSQFLFKLFYKNKITALLIAFCHPVSLVFVLLGFLYDHTLGYGGLLIFPTFLAFILLCNVDLLKRLAQSFEWWAVIILNCISVGSFLDATKFDPPRVIASLSIFLCGIIVICTDARPFTKRKSMFHAILFIFSAVFCVIMLVTWWLSLWLDTRQTSFYITAIDIDIESVGFSAFTTLTVLTIKYTYVMSRSKEVNQLLILKSGVSYKFQRKIITTSRTEVTPFSTTKKARHSRHTLSGSHGT